MPSELTQPLVRLANSLFKWEIKGTKVKSMTIDQMYIASLDISCSE